MDSLDFLDAKEYAQTSLRITNIISSYDLKQALDLKLLSDRLRTTTYRPTQHAALTVVIRKHATTASISSSGKVTLTGSKRVLAAKNAANFVCEILKRVGYPQVSYARDRFRVSNINAVGNAGFEIDLRRLGKDHSANSTYDPEVFPGLVYRMTAPSSVVVNVFTTGKYTVAGAKAPSELREADGLIQRILVQYDRGKN